MIMTLKLNTESIPVGSGRITWIIRVTDNHHHLPVCRGCAAALHAVSAAGRSSHPQTWPLHPASAQWGRRWGNRANKQHPGGRRSYGKMWGFKRGLHLGFSRACVSSGDASACRRWASQRKYGAGEGRGCATALEETGPGAAQDCFWPPQDAKLNHDGWP